VGKNGIKTGAKAMKRAKSYTLYLSNLYQPTAFSRGSTSW